MGIISETPTLNGITGEGMKTTEYTLTATESVTDSGSTISIKFNLTIHDPAAFPDGAFDDIFPDSKDYLLLKLTKGVMVNITLPEATNVDGDDITYTMQGTFATGLVFSPATRQIIGVPT